MKHIASILAFISVLLVSCTNKEVYHKESGTRFHTLYHITYKSTKPLTEAIDSTMSVFNASLNPFDSTSLVSRINRNETDTLDNMMLDVLAVAKDVYMASGGVFDITGAPLFNIWGFGTKKGVTRPATREEIDSIMTFVGHDKLIVDETMRRITKADPRMSIIPSSLSKGYITDLVAATLEANGVTDYMVEIGGEMVCKGINPQGDCWQIGVNKPIEDNTSTISELMSKVSMCEKAGLASSGDYRNYHSLEGQKVSHTIDVRTGYPAGQDILSATVIAPTCILADAWATTFMALGMKESLKILDSHPELKVIFIYADEGGNFKVYERGIEAIPINDNR
ncbi:FAD:protein FMN transferase [Porphyromonas sp.]|uniref:FAD:protein FMN transferase n=1 Tax=Porphyromonas sp. TaxID=1924944 RepID=UPI0026DC621F|nr:FAD:protein FMN transferase [Porphyromonas sp.]MDO4770801.1 FAD:protein FMN transferase [Porphyromonas sp.]